MIFRISLVCLVLCIAWLSLTPKETLTIGNDKISHFIAYGTLMWNVGLLTYSNRRYFVVGIICSLCYGAMLEILQDFVPGRYSSVLDMIANAGGVVMGTFLTIVSYRFLRKLLGEKSFF